MRHEYSADELEDAIACSMLGAGGMYSKYLVMDEADLGLCMDHGSWITETERKEERKEARTREEGGRRRRGGSEVRTCSLKL